VSVLYTVNGLFRVIFVHKATYTVCVWWCVQAVLDGIVDRQRGLYIDLTTQEESPIPEAMSDGRIRVERVSTTKSAAKTQSIGIITVRTQTDTQEYSIGAAVDTSTGETVAADEVYQPSTTVRILLADPFWVYFIAEMEMGHLS